MCFAFASTCVAARAASAACLTKVPLCGCARRGTRYYFDIDTVACAPCRNGAGEAVGVFANVPVSALVLVSLALALLAAHMFFGIKKRM